MPPPFLQPFYALLLRFEKVVSRNGGLVGEM